MTRALGLALVQFLWQGAAVGVVTALALAALRRASANARYLVGVAGLATMTVLPVVTTVAHLNDATSLAEALNVISAPSDVPASMTPAPAVTAAAPVPFSRAWLEPRLPYLVGAWAAGVLLLAGYLLGGWLRVARVRRRAKPVAIDGWTETLQDLAARLGVTRKLALLQSALVEVPAVIGMLRPAIIVPASALAGLSPAHFEAILAHELAHIRRADYLVNILQCVVETLLFYHPAVWWVSKQIRVERENCCDDLAASVCADRVSYARALASLEELRTDTPRLALAAAGGDLLARIRRLVEPASGSRPRFSGGLAMTVVLTALLFAIGTELNVTAIQSPPPPPPPPPQVQRTAPPKPPAPPPAPTPAMALVSRDTDQSASQYFDLAKQAFERGDFAQAEAMANRALELVRAARGMPPPPPPAPRGMQGGRTTPATPPVPPPPPPRIAYRLPRAGSPDARGYIQTIFPPAGLAPGVTGDVVMEATIATDGTVKNTRVISGPEPLRETALASIQKWKFPVRKLNGEPVEMLVMITVRFVR